MRGGCAGTGFSRRGSGGRKVSPAFNIAGDGFLSDFDANATGLLNAANVPEPSSLALLALGFAAGALRFRPAGARRSARLANPAQ